ncbi:MAG: hypothetical protein WCO43_02510 [Chitinophagia bacterium]
MRALTYLVFALSVLTLLPDLSFSQTAVSAPRPGTPGEWRYLGTVNARFTADHDAIVVQGPYDFFRKIKFKVTSAPINLIRLIVTYDDGGLPENIDTRFSIPAGGESRVIDLRGNRRKIRTIEFWYDTKGVLQGRANVSVFGQK